VILSCTTKNLIQPFLALGLAVLMHLDRATTIAVVLLISLSAGFFGVVFGSRFGVQSAEAESTLLISSLLCIITLSGFIWLCLGFVA
jgi:malonate transporter